MEDAHGGRVIYSTHQYHLQSHIQSQAPPLPLVTTKMLRMLVTSRSRVSGTSETWRLKCPHAALQRGKHVASAASSSLSPRIKNKRDCQTPGCLHFSFRQAQPENKCRHIDQSVSGDPYCVFLPGSDHIIFTLQRKQDYCRRSDPDSLGPLLLTQL